MLTPSFQVCQRGLVARPAEPIVEGQTLAMDLPVDALVEGCMVTFRGSLVIGVVGGAGAARPLNAAHIVRNLQLELGSLGVIKNMSGIAAFTKAVARDRRLPPIDSLTTAEIAGAGTYDWSVSLPLDFAQFGFDAEEVGLLVSQAETQISLRATLGTFAADMQTAGTYTITSHTVTVDVARNIIYPESWDASYGTFREGFIRATPTVAGWAELRLPAKKFYRGLHLISYAGAGAAYQLSDAVLVGVELQLNTATYPVRASAAQLRERMQRAGGWPTSVLAPTGIHRWEPSQYSPRTFPRVAAGLDGTLATEIILRADLLAPAGAIFEVHYEILDPPGVQ